MDGWVSRQSLVAHTLSTVILAFVLTHLSHEVHGCTAVQVVARSRCWRRRPHPAVSAVCGRIVSP